MNSSRIVGCVCVHSRRWSLCEWTTWMQLLPYSWYRRRIDGGIGGTLNSSLLLLLVSAQRYRGCTACFRRFVCPERTNNMSTQILNHSVGLTLIAAWRRCRRHGPCDVMGRGASLWRALLLTMTPWLVSLKKGPAIHRLHQKYSRKQEKTEIRKELSSEKLVQFHNPIFINVLGKRDTYH